MAGKRVCSHVKEVPVRGYERRRNGRIEQVRGYVRHIREKVSRHKRKIALAGGAAASAAVIYVIAKRRGRAATRAAEDAAKRALVAKRTDFSDWLVSVLKKEGRRYGVGDFEHDMVYHRGRDKVTLMLDFKDVDEARTFWNKVLVPVFRRRSKKSNKWNLAHYKIIGPRISGQNFANRIYVDLKWK